MRDTTAIWVFAMRSLSLYVCPALLSMMIATQVTQNLFLIVY